MPPIIPDPDAAVISHVIETHADEIWAWASQQYYAELAAQSPDHLLVRIGARFDFAGLEAAYGAYRRYAGVRGQAATHTIGQLCRGLLVKHLYSWSFREAAKQIRTNGLVRGFVGYGLQERTLSHATLHRFAEWVEQQDGGRLLFSEVLRQIDEDFAAEALKVQYGDTFGMEAAARKQTRTELLRSASRHVLRTLTAALPDAAAAVLATLDEAALFGAADEVRETLLAQAERCAREEATALAAAQLLGAVQATVTAHPAARTLERAALESWLTRLEKILHDEFVLERAADGRVTQATLRTKRVKGAYAMGSTVDPDATFRVHGARTTFGYNIHVAATDTFIREIAASTGATPDSAGLADLLTAQQEHLGHCPPKLIYDAAAGAPKHFATVDQASGGQTQLVARLLGGGRRSDRFGPSDFSVGESGELICPSGVVTTASHESSGGDGINYRFRASQCQGCPLLEQCRGDAAPPTKPRTVFISHYAYYQREALAYTQTAQFEAEMKKRAHIERIIAGLVRYNGARRATAHGVEKADFQVRMAAMAYNLKRYVKLTLDKEKAARRRAQAPPAAG